MPKINILCKNVAELIAAGEVIERPASVIKELVENSIDAGASAVTVEIQNGGISFIRVTDDGCGISYEDMPTAFFRHATSKVLSEEDLYNISTMGFRGEALASVAAMARVEMLSKQENSALGGSYKIDGGTEISHIETGCPNGTTIIIKELFFNTPARLKFLKKDVSEGNSVAAIVDKLALAHPEISFRFIRDNKPIRITPGNGGLYSAVYSVFGKQFAASLIPVDYETSGIKITGYASSPLFPRGNRTMQYFFVNTRYIKSTSCTAALEEGYRNSIMTGKFPACVLNIEINPSEVDVNVHPAKTEVRFTNDRLVFDAVYFAVKNAVLNADNNKEVTPPSQIQNIQNAYIPPAAEEPQIKVEQPELNSFSTAFETEKKKKSPVIDVTPKKLKYEQRITISDNQDDDESNVEETNYKFINNDSLIQKRKDKANVPHVRINEQNKEEQKPIKVIGELWKTYIICESGDKLLLIDKHAAHERIRFEKLRKEFISSSQLLAESIYIEMDEERLGALLGNKDLLSDAGIEIKASDKEMYKIKITAIPSALVGSNTDKLIGELADIFVKGGSDISGIFDEILHNIACRSAIKAHDNNDIDDLKALAEAVWNDKGIRYCPHGRPIITSMSKREIEKNFKRIT